MEIFVLSDSFKHALMITSFVMVVMLIIEYINVQTKGKWSNKLQSSRWLQIPLAAFLGIIPGCLGTYTVVSLYSHRITNFAALVTVMIATAGDEAFVMMAMIPGTFLKLTLLIFLIALITGFMISLFPKVAEYQPFSIHRGFHVHENEVDCVCFEPETISSRLKNISFTRALFLAGTVILLILLLLGEIGPEEWNWVRFVLLGSLTVTLFIVSTVPEHFLNEHIWEHIIKKHFIKIFLWTFGTLLVLGFLVQHFEIEQWIRGNMYLILIIALLVGIIPESGPHMVFISLFIAGTIPLSILLANSIVQDGHGSLPLLAESKKSFLYVKLINLFVGLMVGITGVYFNL
jgi:hypothetical protein